MKDAETVVLVARYSFFTLRHLQQVLKEYLAYYNTARPHQGIAQQMPLTCPISVSQGEVRSHPVLAGSFTIIIVQPSLVAASRIF